MNENEELCVSERCITFGKTDWNPEAISGWGRFRNEHKGIELQI
jgi:hypothetical protein